MTNGMDNTTIVAILIVLGTFSLTFTALLKHGTEEAIKMWSVLGVVFGAITAHYFTDKQNETEVSTLQDSLEEQIELRNDVTFSRNALVSLQRDLIKEYGELKSIVPLYENYALLAKSNGVLPNFSTELFNPTLSFDASLTKINMYIDCLDTNVNDEGKEDTCKRILTDNKKE